VPGITTPLQIAPVTLTGRFVRLEPLMRIHTDALAKFAFEPSLWAWTPTQALDRAGLEAWVVVNTDAKYLMLRHAFETLGATRVELKTHSQNVKSRRAIERIAAKFEGIHRKHMLHHDGSRRDTAWYSILDDEWPGVKVRLAAMLR
jgi:hypothetical protein